MEVDFLTRQHHIEDLKYMDAFQPPTIFEDTIDLYKEWHHFVFFDHKSELFGFLNFSVTGNPYFINKGFATIIMLFTSPNLRWYGNLESSTIESLKLFKTTPSIFLQNTSVNYKSGFYNLFGRLQSQSTLIDLSFRVNCQPTTADTLTLEGIAPVWKGWVGIMNLVVNGRLFVDGEEFKIINGFGYHDHNKGRFKWGEPFGWDGGFILGEIQHKSMGLLTVSFLIGHSFNDQKKRKAAVFLWNQKTLEKIFNPHQVQVEEIGNFTGPYQKFPGSSRILWPERPRGVPSKLKLVADDNADHIEIIFTPITLCQIVSSNHLGEGETFWNEFYGVIEIEGQINNEKLRKEVKGYLESVRPAR